MAELDPETYRKRMKSKFDNEEARIRQDHDDGLTLPWLRDSRLRNVDKRRQEA